MNPHHLKIVARFELIVHFSKIAVFDVNLRESGLKLILSVGYACDGVRICRMWR